MSAKTESGAGDEGRARGLARAALVVVVCLPALAMAAAYLDGSIRASPFRALTQESGLWAMRFLVLGLLLGPLRDLTGWAGFARARQTVGLAGFFYTALHLLVWARQYGFEGGFLVEEIAARRYLAVGAGAATALVPLALSSPARLHRALGERAWRRLHLLIHPAVGAAYVHYAMARGFTRTEVVAQGAALLFAFGWRLARRGSRRVGSPL